MIQVTLVCSLAARSVHEEVLQLPEGATATDALQASELTSRGSKPDLRAVQPGVWGRTVEWDQALNDGDRLELCRPLTVDPKVARRERFARQGAGTTGLFARRRQGAKAGY